MEEQGEREPALYKMVPMVEAHKQMLMEAMEEVQTAEVVVVEELVLLLLLLQV
jgi:hypothetical protein